MKSRRRFIRVTVEHDIPGSDQTCDASMMVTARMLEMQGKPVGQVLAELVAACELKIENTVKSMPSE